MMGSCFHASSSRYGKHWTRLPFTGYVLFAPEHLYTEDAPSSKPHHPQSWSSHRSSRSLSTRTPPKPHTSKTLRLIGALVAWQMNPAITPPQWKENSLCLQPGHSQHIYNQMAAALREPAVEVSSLTSGAAHQTVLNQVLSTCK